jgi:hypothetical protein
VQEKYVRDPIKDTSESSTVASCLSAAVFVCEVLRCRLADTNEQADVRAKVSWSRGACEGGDCLVQMWRESSCARHV